MVEVPARSLATTVLAVALVAAALGVAVPATADAPEAREAAFEPHPPIRIHGDEQFLLPGSGVVNGSGTANDPYVIKGWELAPRNVRIGDNGGADSIAEDCKPGTSNKFRVRAHAIEIVDTSAHVVIEMNDIHAQETTVREPFPVTVFGAYADSNYTIGILLVNADHVTIKGNQVGDSAGERLYRGICARQSDDLRIAGNTVEHTHDDGVKVEDSHGVTVQDNVIDDSLGAGLNGAANGVVVWDGSSVAVRENRVTGHATTGIDFVGTPGPVVENNTVKDNGFGGVGLAGTDQAAVYWNDIRSNGDVAVQVSGSKDVDIHRNNLVDNGMGVRNADFTVDATDNYWGCPDGPDDAACDDVWGRVDYDPWLSSPNPSAGA